MSNSKHVKLDTLETQLKNWFIASLSGGERSYSQFLINLTPYLRGFFRKRMQSCPDHVEDLVQETLIAIHTKKHTYDTSLPISAWIHAIAKYKYVDFLRAQHYDSTHENLDEAADLFASCDTAAQESRRDIQKLLDGLPTSFSIPIQLTKIEGYSVQEASKISGMSESVIKIGVHRGLKKLSLALGFKHEH